MPAVHGLHVIKTDRRAGRRRDGVDEWSGVAGERAEVDQPFDAQRDEAAVAVDPELAAQVRGAAVMIADDGLAARADPAHRPAGLLRSQHDGEEFRIDLVADAEAAADVDRVD